MGCKEGEGRVDLQNSQVREVGKKRGDVSSEVVVGQVTGK